MLIDIHTDDLRGLINRHERFYLISIDGAGESGETINVPIDKVRERVPNVVPDKDELIVLCGRVSPEAADTLAAMGYRNLRYYLGSVEDVKVCVPLHPDKH